MPGLIVEADKNFLEDDQHDDSEDSSDNDDDDKEDEPTIVEQLDEIKMKLANIERDIAEFKIMVADKFQLMWLMLEAIVANSSEILAQHSASPSVSHEHDPTPASTSDDTAAVVAIPRSEIPPIETGDTPMPDTAA